MRQRASIKAHVFPHSTFHLSIQKMLELVQLYKVLEIVKLMRPRSSYITSKRLNTFSWAIYYSC